MGIIAFKGLGKAFLKGKNNPLKTQGNMETDPNVRKGIAIATRDLKKKGHIGIKAKKIPRDLSYMKGYLGE